jgi:hypothetical protein
MSGRNVFRRTAAAFAALSAAALAVMPAVSALAETSHLPVDRQLYESTAPQDPCAGTTPPDICITAAGGEETARAFVHVNVDALPAGADLTKLTLTLVPDSANTAGNANASSAAMQACVLTTPLPASVSSTAYPAADCDAAHATGQLQSDGSWTFDLTSLAGWWADNTDTGLAIMPVLSPTVAAAPPTQPPAPAPGVSGVPSPQQTWSLAFLTTKTTAVADYEPAAQPGQSSQPFVVPPAPPPAPPLPQLPVAVAPLPLPSAAPTPAPTPPVAPATVPPLTEPVTGVLIHHGWFLVALALVALAAGVLAGATIEVLRGQKDRPTLATLRAALARGRSRTAATVGLLLVGAAIAVGATGRTVTVTAAPSATQQSAPSTATPTPSGGSR